MPIDRKSELSELLPWSGDLTEASFSWWTRVANRAGVGKEFVAREITSRKKRSRKSITENILLFSLPNTVGPKSCKDVFQNMTMHIGQPGSATLVTEGQTHVVHEAN